jgi:isopenicillin-N epimerase
VSDQRSAAELRQRVATELGCEIAANFWCGHAYLRLSAQIYNRAEQYDRLAAGLPGVLARARSAGRPTA